MGPTPRTTRHWALSVCLALVAAALPLMVAPAGALANGCISPAAGTAQDPFLIATPSNLDCLMGNANYYWGQGYHFRQTSDLDMASFGPWGHGIGSDDTAFTGTYDGDGFAIAGLEVNSVNSNVGLFGVIAGATLKEISLVDVTIQGDDQVGGLVGLALSGVVDQVYVEGVIAGANGVGGLVGGVGSMGPTTISRAAVDDSTTVVGSGSRVGGLIGFTETASEPLTITDVQAAGAVSGVSEAGGLIGRYTEFGPESVSITDSYASGLVTVTGGDSGGLLGCLFDDSTTYSCVNTPLGSFTLTDSYWDTQATDQPTTAGGLGAGKTTAQMTALGTFSGWSIADRAPGNAIWGICPTLNSGYPFLQWVAAQQASTCTSAPAPAPTPIPATPPTGVTAQPGDSSASVLWSAPASSGSFAVSTYLVTSLPDSRSCITSTTSCTVTGLRNGTAYTFTVQALTGAGWSSPSQPSSAVIPVKPRSIVISGARSGTTAIVSGTTSGLSGQSLAVLVRLRGEKSFTERGTVTPDATGTFTWRIRTGKTAHVYLTGDGITSNRVTIPR